MSTGQSEAKQPQIARWGSELANNIESLQKNLEELEGRLVTILSPQEPQAEKSGIGQPQPNLVAHADFLRNQTGNVSMAIQKVQSILRRLEL